MALVIYDGVEFESLALLCKSKGVNYNTVISRLNKNMSLYDALKRSNFKRKDVKEFIYLGKKYDSKSLCCSEHGIDYMLVNYYSKKLSITIGESLTLLIDYFSKYENKTYKPDIITSIPIVIYQGIWYSKLDDFCTACGIDTLFFKNYKARYGLKDNIETMNKIKNHRKEFYLYKGEYYTYTYITMLIRKNKLSYLDLKKLPKKYLNCYTECTFKTIGICIDTTNDFKTYLNSYASI